MQRGACAARIRESVLLTLETAPVESFHRRKCPGLSIEPVVITIVV